MTDHKITTLLLDIGGVLLTNAWGRSSRELAAKEFSLDQTEMNERHHLCFDTYEMGKLSMDDYLKQIVFYEDRSFSKDDFKAFIFNQSKALPDSFEYFKQLKSQHQLKVFSVNNEAKEMNEYRRPFTNAGEDRRPTLTWPRQIPIGGEPVDKVEIVGAYSQWLTQTPIPKLFVNADPGVLIAGPVRDYVRSWPNLTEVTVAGLHFIQEDSPDRIGEAVRDWHATL